MGINEFDGLSKLQGDWKNIGRIIPYGYGAEAKRSLHRIMKEFTVPFIVDQDPKKWGQIFNGVEIVSPQVLEHLEPHDKVLITIAKRRYLEIKQVFDSYRLKENEQYCHLTKFFNEWYQQYRGEYCLYTLHMAITTACTLRCKHCNMFIPYHREAYMASLEDVKRDLELLFTRMDYVVSLDLIGGEALLNPNLPDILKYITNVHGKHIGKINITTNGVVIPSDELIQQLQDYGVAVSISDYTEAIGGKAHVEELVALLTEKNIFVSIMRNRIWCDFGFPRKPWNIPAEKVRYHMLTCDPGWRGLNDGKFYFCHIAWSIEKTGLYKLKDTDYLDLAVMPTGEESKKKILNYSLGAMENEYMSFCKVCGGCGADNQQFVLAGEQV